MYETAMRLAFHRAHNALASKPNKTRFEKQFVASVSGALLAGHGLKKAR